MIVFGTEQLFLINLYCAICILVIAQPKKKKKADHITHPPPCNGGTNTQRVRVAAHSGSAGNLYFGQTARAAGEQSARQSHFLDENEWDKNWTSHIT